MGQKPPLPFPPPPKPSTTPILSYPFTKTKFPIIDCQRA